MNRLAMGVIIAALLAAVGCSMPAIRPSSAIFDELMHKSGLWVQLAQIEPMMQIGVSKSQAQTGPLPEVDTQRLRKAIASTYTADELRAAVSDQLKTTLSPDDATTVLQWLSSDLGLRITALEEAATADPEQAARMMDAGPRVLASLAAPRKERLQRLVKSTNSAEGTANLIIDTSIGVSRGLLMSVPGAATESVDDLKAAVQSQKDRLVEALEPQIVAELAAMYRPLTDNELDRYLAFCESPVGRKYSAASIHAIDVAMTAASVRLGQQMAGSIATRAAPRNPTPVPLVVT